MAKCPCTQMEAAEFATELEGSKQQTNYAADISSIQEARDRIGPYIDKTPVLSSSSLNIIAGRTLFFKCEIFQKGGNHAAALALAAKLRGIPAYIVIPKNAPTCKVENVKRYGGQVIWCEPTMQSRESVSAKVQEETGAELIHPFNDRRIISGQGTIILELLEQVSKLDAIVVPISGGGLISGVAVAAKALKPNIHIFAAEPKGADDAARSKAAGHIVTLTETKTIADGLRACLGDLTWPIVRDLVDEIIVVEEGEIVEAMKTCYEILKLVVEPSGAIGLAAVLSHQFQDNLRWSHCQNIGIVLSGGNVDLAVLWESFQKAH